MQDAALEHSVGVTPRDGPRHCGSRTPPPPPWRRDGPTDSGHNAAERPECGTRQSTPFSVRAPAVLRCAADSAGREQKSLLQNRRLGDPPGKPARNPASHEIGPLSHSTLLESSRCGKLGRVSQSVSQGQRRRRRSVTEECDHGPQSPRAPFVLQDQCSSSKKDMFLSPQWRITIVKCREKKSGSRPDHPIKGKISNAPQKAHVLFFFSQRFFYAKTSTGSEANGDQSLKTGSNKEAVVKLRSP